MKESFFEGRGSLSNFSVPINNEAVAIEDEFVLASNLVHINHRNRAFICSLRKKLFSLSLFAAMER
ncbi:hypothetical protein D3C84_872960 [compost metagenome]